MAMKVDGCVNDLVTVVVKLIPERRRRVQDNRCVPGGAVLTLALRHGAGILATLLRVERNSGDGHLVPKPEVDPPLEAYRTYNSMLRSGRHVSNPSMVFQRGRILMSTPPRDAGRSIFCSA